MKKNDFDNRLQNDLFPEMPTSFESGLKKAMEHEGVRTKKRPTATGIFAGAVSLLAAAACLLIVMIGVMGGGRSGKSHAAAPGEASDTPPMAQSTPGITEAPYTWDWNPKIITLSTGFEFENVEKFQALYTGILSFLKERGESEPDELWLCAIKSRYVKEDTGIRADEYLSGYYVLAQHSFGGTDGPELYCLSEDLEVLWCTEGSSRGPNHAVRPAEDSAARYGHFLYGMALTDAHVTRGALVGTNPKEKTDIEFSMLAWFPNLSERLTESQHADMAREYFLVTVSDHDWDGVMENPILRFETEEGNMDVNMKTELPLVATIQASGHVADLSYWSPEMQEDESGLAPVEPTILDLTDDWYGPETVNTYAQAILRALRMTDLGTPRELWICGVAYDLENEDGTPPESVYILAEYAFDGGPFPELFYYNHGAIEWMTLGAETYDVNVVHHNGNTLAFAVSPAYDGEPLAMTYGKVVLKDGGSDALFPELALDEIRERITGGPYYDLARECYLWMDASEHEVKSATIAAQVNGTTREYTLSRVNVLEPQPVPAMAVESGGVIYPGTGTVLIQSLNEDGVSAEGEPLLAALTNMPLILDLTDDWYGAEIVQQYADAIRRALLTSGEHISSEGIWICGVAYNGENEEGTPPDNAYVLAWNVSDGESSPELFYYLDGQIQWRTVGADLERVNVVYHAGNTVVFGRSPAFDGEPLPMSYGKIVLGNGSDAVIPVLALDEIRERITGGPYYDSARECFLWMDCAEHTVEKLTVAARIDGKDREFTLDQVNVLEPQNVPTMAVETGGVIYPGTVTTLIQSLNEDGVSAEGEPLLAALTNMPFPEVRTVWERPLNLLTASDAVSVGSVEVFTDDLKSMLYNDADIGVIDELPAGDYILCFHTNILGPYSVEAGRYTFTNEYTIYKVTLE